MGFVCTGNADEVAGKVLPSANSFVDTLHQARAAEEKN